MYKYIQYIICGLILLLIFHEIKVKNERINNEIKAHQLTKKEKTDIQLSLELIKKEKNKMQASLELMKKELKERKDFIKDMQTDEDLERRVNNYIEKVRKLSKELQKSNSDLSHCQFKLQDLLDNKVYNSKFLEEDSVLDNIQQELQKQQTIAEHEALVSVLKESSVVFL